jgi:hypothetical protein
MDVGLLIIGITCAAAGADRPAPVPERPHFALALAGRLVAGLSATSLRRAIGGAALPFGSSDSISRDR